MRGLSRRWRRRCAWHTPPAAAPAHNDPRARARAASPGAAGSRVVACEPHDHPVRWSGTKGGDVQWSTVRVAAPPRRRWPF